MHMNSGAGECCTLSKKHSENHQYYVESVTLLQKSTKIIDTEHPPAYLPVHEGLHDDPLDIRISSSNFKNQKKVQRICMWNLHWPVRSWGLSGTHSSIKHKLCQQTRGCEQTLAWTVTQCILIKWTVTVVATRAHINLSVLIPESQAMCYMGSGTLCR